MKLGHWPKLQIWHIPIQWSLYFKTTHGTKKRWSYIAGGLKIIKVNWHRKLHFGTKASHLIIKGGLKIEGCKIEGLLYSLSNPRARNWAYSLSTGSVFLRYWPIFKIVIFGHEFQKLHIHSLSTSGSQNWAYFALRAAVSKIRANFLTCDIWTWNLASGQSSRSCTRTLFLPQGVEIELIFALRAAVSKIRTNLQNCHI